MSSKEDPHQILTKVESWKEVTENNYKNVFNESCDYFVQNLNSLHFSDTIFNIGKFVKFKKGHFVTVDSLVFERMTIKIDDINKSVILFRNNRCGPRDEKDAENDLTDPSEKNDEYIYIPLSKLAYEYNQNKNCEYYAKRRRDKEYNLLGKLTNVLIEEGVIVFDEWDIEFKWFKGEDRVGLYKKKDCSPTKFGSKRLTPKDMFDRRLYPDGDAARWGGSKKTAGKRKHNRKSRRRRRR